MIFFRLLSKNLKITISRTRILPVVLCGCETWSLTLREEYRLRVFENSMLRRISGPKREEMAGGWKRLHDGHASRNKISAIKSRRRGWVGHVTRM
jgi:hypothetical protein